MRKLIITAIVAPLLALGLTACNTMEGLGQDVQSVGGKIENSADRKKSN